MARGPLDRGIEIRHIDHHEASEKFLRLGVWAIVHLPLSVPHGNHGRRLRRLQSGGGNDDPGRSQRFTIGHSRRP